MTSITEARKYVRLIPKSGGNCRKVVGSKNSDAKKRVSNVRPESMTAAPTDNESPSQRYDERSHETQHGRWKGHKGAGEEEVGVSGKFKSECPAVYKPCCSLLHQGCSEPTSERCDRLKSLKRQEREKQWDKGPLGRGSRIGAHSALQEAT